MNKIVGTIVLCVVSFAGITQQLPKVYNQFFMNPYIYNPAYAGVEGHTVLFFTYKKQWTGISDAPTLMNANFHVPLKGGISIGGLAYNETAGLYTQSGGKLSGSYLVSIDREHFFRFGLSLGAGNNTLNFGEFDSPNDPAFANLLENETFFLGDFGATYHFGHFNVGVALPSLFSYDLFTTESNVPIRVTPQDNLLFKMNYRGHINDNLAVEPHLIYRYSKFLNDQYEATLIFHLMHIVWVGGTYRQDAGFVGLLGAKLYEKIGIGYSYEYGNPNTASLAGPSHEIHIGYHLGSRKRHAQHTSSFIKSHQKSADIRAREEELERQRRLQALRESRQAAAQTDDDELTIVQQDKPQETQPEPKATNWSYEKENDPVERVNQFGETERGIKFDRVNKEGEKEVVFSWLPPPPVGATSETYEIANPDEEPLIRTKPDGTREAGIKWVRTIDDGQPETLIIWDEIMSEEAADELDHNPSTTMSMDKAKITIKRAPVVTEEPMEETPVEEDTTPVVIEEKPVEETPVTDEPEEDPIVVEDTEEVQKGDPALTDDFRSHEELSTSDEPLEVTRGSHLLELPAGNYVVAGVFESFSNAENFSDELFQNGFRDVKVGFLTARGYYYVVIFQSDDFSATLKEKNRIRQNSGLTKVWVLKVNE